MRSADSTRAGVPGSSWETPGERERGGRERKAEDKNKSPVDPRRDKDRIHVHCHLGGPVSAHDDGKGLEARDCSECAEEVAAACHRHAVHGDNCILPRKETARHCGGEGRGGRIDDFASLYHDLRIISDKTCFRLHEGPHEDRPPLAAENAMHRMTSSRNLCWTLRNALRSPMGNRLPVQPEGAAAAACA